ncbi:unnamed protein product [Camellia sinensis]
MGVTGAIYSAGVLQLITRRAVCKCDPLVAVAEEKVKVDQFSTLREHDLCVRIQQYQTSAEEEFSMCHDCLFILDDISPEDIASALEVFRNYDKPLKIVKQALRGVNIKDLEKNLPKTSDVFLSDNVKTTCSVLADGIIVGLYEYLAPLKASALKDFEKAVIFPLSDVCFGPCTDELTEVIKIANHERRMQGERFISVKHILFGLSLSSVGECVERILNDRGLNCLGGFPLKLSSFSIYKLSRDAATVLGNWICDKDVGLEHLVLAIFFGKQESDRTGTANGNTECGVESFDDSEAFKSLLPEDCLDAVGGPYSCGFFIMEELHKTFECGLKLNAIP